MTISTNHIPLINFIMILTLVLTLFNGFRKGFFRSLFDFIGVILAFVIAFWFNKPVAEVFPLVFFKQDSMFSLFMYFFSQTISQVLWFIILFFGTLFILKIIAALMRWLEQVPGISILSKIAGAIISVAEWFVLASLLLILLNSPFVANGRDIIDRSFLTYVDQTLAKIDQYDKYVTKDMKRKEMLGDLSTTDVSDVNDLSRLLRRYGLSQEQIKNILEGLKDEFFTP